MQGLKTFESIEPHPAPGENFSTLEHPIQSFQWADYSVHPGYSYTYTIQCMYGETGKLISKRKITIPIKAEVESGKTHSAFFNRGSVATQEYARRFLNKPPDIAGPGAYEWLSRGLIDAIVAFIGRAKSGHSLHGAIYEFHFPAILNAIKSARARGAKIKIIYDDVETVDKDGDATGPWEKNIEAIGDAGIKTITRGRKNAKLMHNKFLVLSDGNNPKAVLTCSTNITENGIFGHANVAHIVENPAIAEAYKNYYERLLADPDIDNDYRDANMVATPVPQALKNGTTPIFSPRRGWMTIFHLPILRVVVCEENIFQAPWLNDTSSSTPNSCAKFTLTLPCTAPCLSKKLAFVAMGKMPSCQMPGWIYSPWLPSK